MRRSLLKAAVVAVLLCAVVCSCASQPVPAPTNAGEHHCGFDELEEETIATRVSRVSRTANTDGKLSVATAASTAWRPLRIVVFANDVANRSRHCTRSGELRPNFRGGNLTCESADVLTRSKMHTLLGLLVPLAMRLHQERLSVQRESGNLVVDASIKQDPVCGLFSIPDAHVSTGVVDADFVLYLSAGPTSGGGVAWATRCQHFANGRPSVGVLNVAPRYISADPQTMRFVAHEILHALGFSFRYFEAQSMVATVSGMRGKPPVIALKSPLVVARAAAHFGCNTQAFMELEDMGGNGTVRSHWKRRSMKDDLMAGLAGAGVYSAITIAAMEDTGFYKGNYSMAEPMGYGRNAGCELRTRKCIVDGVSQFPDMFCTSTAQNLMCASDRLGVGVCAMWTYPSPLPAVYQYFANSSVGGFSAQMDYCPYVQAYNTMNCTYDTNSLRGSVFGVMSRCLDTPAGVAVDGKPYEQYGLCAEIECAAATYAVKVSGASRFTPCTPGTNLTLASLSRVFSGGYIGCPSYDSVCGMRVDAAQYKRYGAALADGTAAGPPACMTAALTMAAAALVFLMW
ncbi:major surface protease gp63 [Novymonas esmeraldas]|uniref:Leishmanolysin-like peptidase n=1 Tax=Novymonas esmeraldas TaxID=1808958 RepID=A0AAW0EZX1_9TRYP